MNIEQNFIKIWNIDLHDKINHDQAIQNFIPIEWQLILISDGSLTQNISIIKKDLLSLKLINEKRQLRFFTIVNKQSNKSNNYNTVLSREIWLINQVKYKILFAKSYYNKEIFPLDFLNNSDPLGRSLIESEIEIYRKINKIYYGYSQILEKKFNIKGPLWGRSYHILYRDQLIILINEFFSPIIIN
jgi:chorismate-pyruvate lyase